MDVLRKYRYMILVALLFVGTVMYYRYKVTGLREELFYKEIERVMDVDRVVSDMLHRQGREIDSLLRVERLRYDSLQIEFTKIKRSYEKIAADYGDIVIDRPEF